MKPADQSAIEHFVRVTLGCKCPDEVFQSIAVERVDADEESGPGSDHVRLTIGDRLLIYVFAPASEGVPPNVVAGLARAGLTEREARGLNRFRLVVARLPHDVSAGVQQEFARVASDDARAHLHLVDTASLPTTVRP